VTLIGYIQNLMLYEKSWSQTFNLDKILFTSLIDYMLHRICGIWWWGTRHY